MKTMDNKTLLAVALKYDKVKNQEVISLMEAIDFSCIKKLSDLKKYFEEDLQLPSLYTSEKAWNSARSLEEQNTKYGVYSFSFLSKGYPKHLKAINAFPAVLHVRGNVDIIQEPKGVAVVGTRKASESGQKIAYRVAKYMAENGWVVVSGLALGIDAKAHQGALSSEKLGATVAVLAHGLEKALPATNASLGQEILDKGGAWVSEHEIGISPTRSFFVDRNRIQLGLSAGSVLIEAEEKSGTMTQARFCIEQKRPLFAVQPQTKENLLGLVCAGTTKLVEAGQAKALQTKGDYPIMLKAFEDQIPYML